MITKVILLIETSTGYGRGLLRGIAKYSRLHSPWVFYRESGGFEKIPPKLKNWGAKGIIMRDISNNKVMLKMRLPTITAIRKSKRIKSIPVIKGDSTSIGTMGAKHFTERSFRHFAYCGWKDMPWSQNRRTFALSYID